MSPQMAWTQSFEASLPSPRVYVSRSWNQELELECEARSSDTEHKHLSCCPTCKAKYPPSVMLYHVWTLCNDQAKVLGISIITGTIIKKKSLREFSPNIHLRLGTEIIDNNSIILEKIICVYNILQKTL